MARQNEPIGHAAAVQELCCAAVVTYWPAEDVHAEGAVAPVAQKKCGGHGICVVLADEGKGQKKPGEQRFESDAVLLPVALKQEPAAHTVHIGAEPVL